MSQVSILFLILMTLAANLPAFAEEEPDSPAPVTTVTKRSGINSRHLPALVELTEKNSPIIQKARNDMQVAKMEMENQKWALFPQLNLEQKLGYLDNDPHTRFSPTRSETTLSLRQYLFDDGDWAPNFTRSNQAKTRYERVKLEYEYKRDEQLLAVANAYMDWSATLELREIDENKRDLLRRQFNVLEAQYKQGLKTKRDVLRIETEIKKLDIGILSRDNEVDLNFQKLASAVGVSKKELDEQDIEAEEAKPFGVMKSNETEIKIEDHRRAKIFSYLEKEASYDTKLIAYRYWPSINLENEIKYYNQDYIDSGKRFDENEVLTWQSMVILRYNLWDFGVRRRNWEIQKVKENSVHQDNTRQLFELSIVLRDTFLKLREFRETVKTTRELLVLEQQSYSILEAEYRNGRAAYLDLITNLNSLIDARSKFMTSYFGFKKQQLLYAFHKGDIYEDLKQK